MTEGGALAPETAVTLAGASRADVASKLAENAERPVALNVATR